MSFIKRYQTRPVKSAIQLNSMDSDLRTSLWNCLSLVLWSDKTDYEYGYDEDLQLFVRYVWLHSLKQPIDTIPSQWYFIKQIIRNHFFSLDWDEVYEFIELTAKSFPHKERRNDFIKASNLFLEKELSGYRIIGNEVVQITDELEIDEIEDAINSSRKGTSTHLRKALSLLSDRKKPDCRNSIKESISAVGQICRDLTGESTLGEALKKIENKIPVDRQLKSGFQKLYAYTNGPEGIRHELMDEPNTGFDEAKFMLVACAAFVNYLTAKSSSIK